MFCYCGVHCHKQKARTSRKKKQSITCICCTCLIVFQSLSPEFVGWNWLSKSDGVGHEIFHTVDGKKKRRSPVEVGSFILLFTRFRTSEVVGNGISEPISSSAFFLVYNPTSSTSSSLNFPGGFATSPVTRLNSVLLKKRTFQGTTGIAHVAGVCRKKRKGEESIICQNVHCSTQWHRGLSIVKRFHLKRRHRDVWSTKKVFCNIYSQQPHTNQYFQRSQIWLSTCQPTKEKPKN